MINYTTSAEVIKPENKDKIVISQDAYAIVDLIDKLIDKIEHTRASLM